MVIATQNPVEFEGTYPLPESQLDRFLLRIPLGYSRREVELQVLRPTATASRSIRSRRCSIASRWPALQAAVRQVEVEESINEYLLDIVQATRRCDELQVGVSTRGVLALYRAAQAAALVAGRQYVVPDDVKQLAVPVLAHRVIPQGLSARRPARGDRVARRAAGRRRAGAGVERWSPPSNHDLPRGLVLPGDRGGRLRRGDLKEVNLLLILAGMLLGPLLLNWQAVGTNFRGLRIERNCPWRSRPAICFRSASPENARRRLASWAVVVEDQIRRETRRERQNHRRQPPLRAPRAFSLRARRPVAQGQVPRPVAGARPLSVRSRAAFHAVSLRAVFAHDHGGRERDADRLAAAGPSDRRLGRAAAGGLAGADRRRRQAGPEGRFLRGAASGAAATAGG